MDDEKEPCHCICADSYNEASQGASRWRDVERKTLYWAKKTPLEPKRKAPWSCVVEVVVSRHCNHKTPQ